MTNIQIINDVHLSEHAPVNTTNSYLDDLFDLLYQTVEVAKQYKAVTVFAGDVFHLKSPMRNSHALIFRTIDLINSYPHQVYIVPGNHDLKNDHMDSIPSQPVGILLKTGAKLLKGWDETGLPLYGVPWLQRFTDAAVSFALEDWRVQHEGFRRALVVTHAPLYPLGKELPYENYPVDKWAAAMGGTGNVSYGHVHDYHGVHEAGGVTFCNNGALSRGSLTEHHMKRKVLTTLWSSINGEFTEIELKYKPAEEVFRVEKVSKEKAVQVKLDDFLKSVGQATIEFTSVDQVMVYVKSLKLSEEIENIIKELLDEAAVR